MTSERLNLTTPEDRRHWGYGSSSVFDEDKGWEEGGEGEEEMDKEEAALCKRGKKEFYGHGKRMPGVLEWAEENGLVVVGMFSFFFPQSLFFLRHCCTLIPERGRERILYVCAEETQLTAWDNYRGQFCVFGERKAVKWMDVSG